LLKKIYSFREAQEHFLRVSKVGTSKLEVLEQKVKESSNRTVKVQLLIVYSVILTATGNDRCVWWKDIIGHVKPI